MKLRRISCWFLIAMMIALTGCQREFSLVHQSFDSSIFTRQETSLTLTGLRGTHVIGFVCPPERWEELHSSALQIKLSIDGPAAGKWVTEQVGTGVHDRVPDCHSLFTISAVGELKLKVQMPDEFLNRGPGVYQMVVVISEVQTMF